MQELHTHEIESIKEFDVWAKTYHKGLWAPYFTSSYKRIAEVARPYLSQGVSVFDIACGTGGLGVLIYPFIAGGEYTGMDISSEMISQARKGVRAGERKTFLEGRVDAIPRPDNSFDVIFCLNAFHHFPDPMHALGEIHRVLKPGGIYIMLDNVNDGILKKIWIPVMTFLCNEKDVSFRSRRAFEDLLARAGFSIEKSESFLYFTQIFVVKKQNSVIE